jgi:hypothetical protein
MAASSLNVAIGGVLLLAQSVGCRFAGGAMADQYRNTQKSNLSPVIERFIECAREVIRSRGEFSILNSPKSGLLKKIIALDQWFVFETRFAGVFATCQLTPSKS